MRSPSGAPAAASAEFGTGPVFLIALILGYLTLVLIAIAFALMVPAGTRYLIGAILVALALGAIRFASLRILLTDRSLIVRSLSGTATVPYSDIVRSIVEFDKGSPMALYVQREAGPAVTISIWHLSPKAQENLLGSPSLRVVVRDESGT